MYAFLCVESMKQQIKFYSIVNGQLTKLGGKISYQLTNTKQNLGLFLVAKIVQSYFTDA